MAFPDYLAKGDAITADHYHEVTRAARAQLGGNGFADRDGGAPRPNRKSPQVIQVYSEVAIPKNSVFQIGLASQTDDITIFNVQLADGTTNKILCTNDVNALAANSFGYATIIPPDSPIKVKADISNMPDVLEKCGAADNEATVSSGQTGLICLSLPDTNNLIEVVSATSGGGSSGRIWFRVIAIDYYLWALPGCEFVRAVVTQVSCDTTLVNVGDEVDVFDPMYCWFNLPITILMQMTGTATLSKKSDLNLLRCGVDLPGCFWSVDGVCCLEEDYAS